MLRKVTKRYQPVIISADQTVKATAMKKVGPVAAAEPAATPARAAERLKFDCSSLPGEIRTVKLANAVPQGTELRRVLLPLTERQGPLRFVSPVVDPRYRLNSPSRRPQSKSIVPSREREWWSRLQAGSTSRSTMMTQLLNNTTTLVYPSMANTTSSKHPAMQIERNSSIFLFVRYRLRFFKHLVIRYIVGLALLSRLRRTAATNSETLGVDH